MKKQQIIWVLMISIILTSCSDKTTVGWIGPLSGDYALVGRENLRGVQLALDEFNNSAIKLVVEDDQYDETKTITAYQKLTQVENAKSLLLVTYGGVLALGPQAESDNTIIVSSVDTSEEIANAGENVFGIGIYDEGIGFELADFAVNKLSAKTIGVLYNNVDPFILLVVESFKQKAGDAQIIVEQYQPEDKDFRTQLAKLKEVDALLIIGFDEAGLAAKQARELGIKAHLLGIDTVLSKSYKNNAGPAYEGMYFTSWTPSDKEQYASFVERYKSKFGEEPQQILFAATGYDAAKTLFSALDKDVKSELASLQSQGLTGTLTMSQDGIVRSVQEQMHQIQDGQAVALN